MQSHNCSGISESKHLYQAGGYIVHLKNVGNTTTEVHIPEKTINIALSVACLMLFIYLLFSAYMENNRHYQIEKDLDELRRINNRAKVELILGTP